MDVGDLPFRYVGKHRRMKLKDVLALKTKMDAQLKALEALAANAEENEWAGPAKKSEKSIGPSSNRLRTKAC